MAKSPNPPASSDQAAQPAAPSSDPAPAAPIPAVVEMASAFGFYDDAGAGHFWNEGQIVTDPDDIALLVAQNAPFRA